MSVVRTYACREVPRLLGEIEHQPYLPQVHGLVLVNPRRSLAPWSCLTCWRPKPGVEQERATWPCKWARLEFKDCRFGEVEELLEWAAAEVAEDLGLSQADAWWRIGSWRNLPQRTAPLQVLPRQPHGLGAAGGRTAVPTKARRRR